MDATVTALINYYAREGQVHHVQTACNDLLKRGASPLLLFWRAYGLLAEGSSAEALRELQTVQHNGDVALAATAAMLMAHESGRVVDHEAIASLGAKLEMEERLAIDAPALHLAAFLSHTHSHERARALLERALQHQPALPRAQALLGWVLVRQYEEEDEGLRDEGDLEQSLVHFGTALQQDPADLEAMLGKAKVAEVQGNHAAAAEQLTELTVRFPTFVPALAERARLLLCIGEWEQMSDCVALVLQADRGNACALGLAALYALVREGNSRAAVQHLQEAATALQQQEPKSAELACRLAVPFARLAGQDVQLLPITMGMAQRALQLKPDNCAYAVEVAYQHLLQYELATAAECYSSALQLDELSLDANYGCVEVHLAQGELTEAAEQLAFLSEITAGAADVADGRRGVAGSSGRAGGGMNGEGRDDARLLYLQGLLAWKQGKTADGVALLEKGLARQQEAAAAQPLGLARFSVLNPGRVLGVVRLMLGALGGEPRAATEAPSPMLAKCTRALDMLARHCPALPEAQLLYARTHFLNGSLDAAQRKAADVLRACPDDPAVHLLVCSIYVHQGRAAEAQGALEAAVSANFGIREAPLYHIISAQVLVAEGKLEEARKVLEGAMAMPGVRTALTPAQRERLVKRGLEPSLHERASIYLLLVEVLAKTSKLPEAPEANKYIADAVREFGGTSEEVRVTIADCELAIARGDVEGALKRLRQVPSSSPHYMRARVAMAGVFLKHRRDRAAYIQCYVDLVDKTPDFDSYCMLGEALLSIHEPEKAVRAFESALELNPKDSELTLKCARALVTAHDYARAIDYYNRAIRNAPSDVGLQHQLAQLLMRLGRGQQAAALLQKCLDRPKEGSKGASVEALSHDVETWLLLAQLHARGPEPDRYADAQSQALELQRSLLGRLRGELPDSVAAQKAKAAAICYDLAEHHKRARRFEQAQEAYAEALTHCDSHTASHLALAHLALAAGDVDACQARCTALLRADPDNEEGGLMLAELMAHQENYDSAIHHYQQLLEHRPAHHTALAQLLQLLRRAGRLEDAPRFITAAETAAGAKASTEPGILFCKGLLSRYLSKPRDALKHFNAVRKDSKWSAQALMHMAEVVLNPDNDAAWGQDKGDQEADPEAAEAVRTATTLLHQLRPADMQSNRYKVLTAYTRMASKQRGDVEAALGQLLDLTNADPNNVPVLLALAQGFMLLKQTPKARNQLKRVAKLPYNAEEADDFERAWLLLADIHIQGGKFDLAQELCARCLKYNRSCGRAWELLGSVAEREQAYKDAASHYESAWKCCGSGDAQIGYKLAFNYLKAHRLVEAITTAQEVLAAFPDYPKIRKDVLDKARIGLRP